MSDNLFDVAIVGASVSGASLAIHLGAEGLSVALIDKAGFPRRKACGEGVSDIALESLYQIGLEDDIGNLQGLPFCSYRLDFSSHSLEFASGRGSSLKGVGIPRYLLDKALIDKASTFSPVQSILETAVTGIDRSGEQFILHLSSGKQISARYLVLADGANSGIATKLGISKTKGKRPVWGVSFVLEGDYQKLTKEVLIILKDGFEVYCTPVSRTLLNVVFLTGKEKIPYLQDEKVREELLREAKEKCFFQGEVMEDPIFVGPVGATKRCYRHGRILLLGDAAESLDPISGMGITHGVLSAELAAKALISIKNNSVSEEKALDGFVINCERVARLYRGFARLTAGLLRSPLRNRLIPALVKTNLPYLIRNTLSYHSSERAFSASCFRALLHLIGR